MKHSLRIFARICAAFFAVAVSACLFAFFGGLCAFFVLVFSGESAGRPKTPPNGLLKIFLEDAPSGTSRAFTLEEIDGGFLRVLTDSCGEISKEAVVAPIAPKFTLENGKLTAHMPVNIWIAGMRKTAEISFVVPDSGNGGISVLKIGRASVPEFAVRMASGRILGEGAKSLASNFALFGKFKITAIDNGRVLLEK